MSLVVAIRSPPRRSGFFFYRGTRDTIKTLLEKANRLPMLPGVYIMLDDKGEVIYVGKAKKLKNRVSSYFHGEHLPKVAAMVAKEIRCSPLDYIVKNFMLD